MSVEDRLARVALSRVVEPGSRRVAAAVTRYGPAVVWEALRSGQRPEPLTAALVAGAATRAAGYDPQRDLAAAQRLGARVVTPRDEEWPGDRLAWTSGLRDAPPLALYVQGPTSLSAVTARAVAVVGARAATAYGVHVAKELGLALAERGWSAVSGGAYGIDGAAHEGALAAAAAPTVAVLACGVDVAYPRGHDRLLARIGREGLLISEWPPGCAPTRSRFLVRNRVIAALSVGTVVVEAAARSGSLTTARLAGELGRDVMAVPGPVTSAMSAGSHELLRNGAVCVTRAAEVLDTVGELSADAAEPVRGPASPRDGLSDTVRQVLDAVPVRSAAGEASIARTAGVSSLVVQQVLPPLLVAGLVERGPGGWRLTPLGAGRPAAGQGR